MFAAAYLTSTAYAICIQRTCMSVGVCWDARCQAGYELCALSPAARVSRLYSRPSSSVAIFCHIYRTQAWAGKCSSSGVEFFVPRWRMGCCFSCVLSTTSDYKLLYLSIELSYCLKPSLSNGPRQSHGACSCLLWLSCCCISLFPLCRPSFQQCCCVNSMQNLS